jgi:hypothetical protein
MMQMNEHNDSVSDTSSPSHESEASETPQIPKVLLGISALLFVVILGAGIFGVKAFTSGSRNSRPEQVEQVDLADTAPVESVGDQDAPESDYPLSGGNVRISSIESGLHVMGSNLSNVAESMMEFRSSIARLDQRQAQSDSERKVLLEQTTDHQARLEQISSDIEKIHALLRTQGAALDQMNAVIKEQERVLGQMQRERALMPPFVLLSVDDWGKQRHAVLELDGVTTLARPGEVRAGWRVVAVLPDRVRLLRLSDELEYELLREGSR